MRRIIPSCKNFLWTSYRFIAFVAKHFIDDNCTYRASALAFTSLLAIVPLMSVGLSILSAFPVFQDLRDPLQNFIFENFVPATGKAVQSYLQQFTAQVSRMSISGVVFLFVTAILVMVTIENSLNNIWRVAKPRKGVPAFLLYWAILSLAPILLGLSIAATSWFVSMPFIKTHQPSNFLVSGIPVLFSFVAFTFMYVVVPNCVVGLRNAIWGGLLAAVLFEVAKHGFAWYLTRYNSYQLLYGAFALVPIFFIWVYWVWVITLLGAEISYALSVHYERRRGMKVDGFTQALLWLEALWKAQKKGKSVSFEALINTTHYPYAIDVIAMMRLLEAEKLIHPIEQNRFMLSQSMSNLSLSDLMKKLPFPIPSNEALIPSQTPLLKRWHAVTEQHQQCVDTIMSQKLSLLFADK